MKAIHVRQDTKERELVWADTPDPTYGDNEVLVDIYATALNRADLAQRAGNYPPPPGAPDTMGLEMAGRIAAVGSEVSQWKIGDRVCALLGGGGYAEQVTVHQDMLIPIPENWTYVQAAGLPEVFLTAFVNLYMEAGLAPGETTLVHGGGSGVGTAAIQLAITSGNPIIVTAGSEEKLAQCRTLGANLAINYKEEDFVERTREFTDGEGVDVIMDMVGADYFQRNLSLLKNRGRLVFIATLSGGKAEFDIGTVMRRRIRLIGSVLRTRSLQEKIAIKDQFLNTFGAYLNTGKIAPVIDNVYPITEAGQAHQYMADFNNIGKIILQVRE